MKKEETAISKQMKQKKQLDKVRNKSPSDEHSIVSFDIHSLIFLYGPTEPNGVEHVLSVHTKGLKLCTNIFSFITTLCT